MYCLFQYFLKHNCIALNSNILSTPCTLYTSIFAAVKFGRMSKKQREKVEDEANFHKQRLNGFGMVDGFPSLLDPNELSPTNNNNYA